jgi:hypothetical protein
MTQLDTTTKLDMKLHYDLCSSWVPMSHWHIRGVPKTIAGLLSLCLPKPCAPYLTDFGLQPGKGMWEAPTKEKKGGALGDAVSGGPNCVAFVYHKNGAHKENIESHT